MKRILIAAAALGASLSLYAEGYQINTLSARQLGMGHTGVALKLGAENMIFNPAGLGFSDKTIDITGSVTGIKADATARYNGEEFKTENDLATPLAVNASFKIYDNLQAGVSFYTPYGSSINWTKNWPGAELNQCVNLKVYTVQPTIAWRIIPKLSVGVGLTLSWGSVDLDKGLVGGATFDAIFKTQLGHTPAASINLKGTSQVAVGANIGVMYDINKQWTVGAGFRTQTRMKVNAGIARVSFANDATRQALESTVGLINEANFSASMPAPWILNMGVSYKPISKLTLAFDAQLTGWHAYKALNIAFPGELSVFNQDIAKEYKNSWCFKLGAEYALTNRLDIRAGMMVDTTPVDMDHYNPETPGMTKIEPTVGFSFRPISNLSIDFAFMYVAGLGVDNAKCTYDDLLLKSLQMPYLKTFQADYRVHAFAPSIGLRYSF